MEFRKGGIQKGGIVQEWDVVQEGEELRKLGGD